MYLLAKRDNKSMEPTAESYLCAAEVIYGGSSQLLYCLSYLLGHSLKPICKSKMPSALKSKSGVWLSRC